MIRWLLALGLLMAACTTPAPPSPSPAGIAVCALVPNMDELVGKTAIDVPAGFSVNGFDKCTWTYAADPSRFVGLSVGPVRGHSTGIDSLGQGQQIPALGDDARWWVANRLLSVAIGEQSVQVSLSLADEDVKLELAERIARAAVDNLD